MSSDNIWRKWQLVIYQFSAEDMSQIPGGNSSKSQQWSKLKYSIIGIFRLDWVLLNLDMFLIPSHKLKDIFSKFWKTTVFLKWGHIQPLQANSPKLSDWRWCW